MKKIIALFVFSFVLVSFGMSQVSTDDYLNKGLQAYKDGNWESAILLLKNAVSLPESSTPEVLYVLVMSEMFNGDYDGDLYEIPSKCIKATCSFSINEDYDIYKISL